MDDFEPTTNFTCPSCHQRVWWYLACVHYRIGTLRIPVQRFVYWTTDTTDIITLNYHYYVIHYILLKIVFIQIKLLCTCTRFADAAIRRDHTGWGDAENAFRQISDCTFEAPQWDLALHEILAGTVSVAHTLEVNWLAEIKRIYLENFKPF